MKALLLAAGATPAIALLAAALPTAQQPLGWKYPWSCCSNQDCRAEPNGVAETPAGYTIKATGEVIPYGDKRIKNSPDQDFHVCAHRAGLDAGKVICLFIPPRGF
jgi:hypothetical protein